MKNGQINSSRLNYPDFEAISYDSEQRNFSCLCFVICISMTLSNFIYTSQSLNFLPRKMGGSKRDFMCGVLGPVSDRQQTAVTIMTSGSNTRRM